MKTKIFNYDRWQYTISLEEFVSRRDINKKYFLQLLERDIFGDSIVRVTPIGREYAANTKNKKIVKKANLYAIVTADGEEYNVVLENCCKSSYEVILLYENHYSAYHYRLKPTAFDLSYEVVEYQGAPNGKVVFSYSHNDKLCSTVISTFLFEPVDIIFATQRKNISIVELIRDGNYSYVLDSMSKYKETECGINELFDVYKLIVKQITSKVQMFTVKLNSDYSLIYKNGHLEEMRTMINRHYVICDRAGELVWQESLCHHEDFTYTRGKVYNGRKAEVTDIELAEKIISNINEGEKLFKNFQKQLSSN